MQKALALCYFYVILQQIIYALLTGEQKTPTIVFQYVINSKNFLLNLNKPAFQ